MSTATDARRVQRLLTSGSQLWIVLVAKNLVLVILAGFARMIISALVIIRTGDTSAFIKAIGQLFALIFIWLGMGNVLSILSPLRAEPISERRRDGTLRRFALSFVVSFGLGYLVNFMLYWRVWAKTTLIERLGSPWIPVLLIIGSSVVLWLLLTVLASTLARKPEVRREVRAEMIDYRAARGARVPRQ